MDISHELSALAASSASSVPDLSQLIDASSDPVFLLRLASLATNPKYTDILFRHLEQLFADVCSRLLDISNCVVVTATFGRIVPFAPYLEQYAEVYLSRPHAHGGLLRTPASEASLWTEWPEDQIISLLLGLFRLLVSNNRLFACLVNASKLAAGLSHKSRPIRYITIRIMCLYMHAADAAMEKMISKYLGESSIEGPWEEKTIDYRFLSLWEEQRHEQISCGIMQARERILSLSGEGSTTRCVVPVERFSSHTCCIAGILLPRFNVMTRTSPQRHRFVPTTTSILNAQNFAEGLQTGRPLLLHGAAGGGKTMLIAHVADELGKLENMITLHLNEQSDAKALIGMYTSGDDPGSFLWKPGPLTTAVGEGRWVLIEDLDRAPSEIISVLLPLIERRELLITGRGEVLPAARGFQIVATIRTLPDLRGKHRVPNSQILGLHHWNQIPVHLIRDEELRQVVETIYPVLKPMSPQIINIYSALRLISEEQRFAARVKTGIARPITPRDLMKWCQRMSAFITDANAIPEVQYDHIFLDAMDCFAGYLAKGEASNSLASTLAKELHIDPSRRDHILFNREVEFSKSNKGVGPLRVGRAKIASNTASRPSRLQSRPFAINPHTSALLERVSVAVAHKEPMLLVGETGTGKTTCIQYLADQIGRKLVPFNLSQQSESSDLLGGFKPVNMRTIFTPLREEFEDLFLQSFSAKGSQPYLERLGKLFAKGQWKSICQMWQDAAEKYSHLRTRMAAPQANGVEHPSKRQKVTSDHTERTGTSAAIQARWTAFRNTVKGLKSQLARKTGGFAFAFVEGALVKAVRNGDWLLLDEINLASSETLEAIVDLLGTGSDGPPTLLLAESGSLERVVAHQDFRVFAAMNPATDVGKRELPTGIRSRFTEIYVESPDRDRRSLISIVESYIGTNLTDRKAASDVADLYLEIQSISDMNALVDGAAQKPHFSLRTLTRAAAYARDMSRYCSLRRALYEGFLMAFSTLLDKDSEAVITPLILKKLFANAAVTKSELGQPFRQPNDGKTYIQEGHHWLRQGSQNAEDQSHYIITPFVRHNLNNLIRAISTRRHPILLQGPTSSGKTSMIEYLAKRSGNKFVRINNHEHTDLQEYLGSYISDANGNLKFQDGVLVQALREGSWLVLDELNLAPTDVLEALNRLLDDNRELMIPETQETVRPHPDFMLFATQNPAGLYGGRKHLSRAFRNRFVELHFDDIPVEELCEILHRRTQIPESWSRRIVDVYRELSALRQENRLFEQKSFATLRDLFRWALRSADTVQQLAINGFMLLGERVRKDEERQRVRQVIETVLSRKGPRVHIDESQLFTPENSAEIRLFNERCKDSNVVWTSSMCRLYVLVAHALRNNEPVLLVGETGCGKTTVCQMLAEAFQKRLLIVNAHQNIETGDIIGSQRPIRNRAAAEKLLKDQIISALDFCGITEVHRDTDTLLNRYDSLIQSTDKIPVDLATSIHAARTTMKALFEWHDGALIEAMKDGQLFLLDEISLADDSVLERLNSVLEPHRTVLLAEKGSQDSFVAAADGFQFFATMNPGGDYGKRELSPALRNRFTEIWVPAIGDANDVLKIVRRKLLTNDERIAAVIVRFAHWFASQFRRTATLSISVRDVLAWAEFMNLSADLDVHVAILHGAAMVYIDTIGANPAAILAVDPAMIQDQRRSCLVTLGQIVSSDLMPEYSKLPQLSQSPQHVTIGHFALPRDLGSNEEAGFSLEAPTTRLNAMRLFRALQLRKPVLIEGNPGVGKTTLVAAIARLLGKRLVRINLSEQTDLMDLFGSDVPVEGAVAGTFAWRDAPFLSAMKAGDWVLLDEMNLASQSVLEGLNACLDHRGEAYISELNQTFSRHPSFRIFAAQNPHHQGGGRKGLPTSFVNRFTVVYADVFKVEDLRLICGRVFPQADESQVNSMIALVDRLETDVTVRRRFGTLGSPWEFNLRDTLRWLELATSKSAFLPAGNTFDFCDIIFRQRFRQSSDRNAFDQTYQSVWNHETEHRSLFHSLTIDSHQVGMSIMSRDTVNAPTCIQPNISVVHLPLQESLSLCIQQRWPVILVGAPRSGKSTLLRHAAGIAGKTLTVFPMNADIDAMDLVGGFEQADPLRIVIRAVKKLEHLIRHVLIKTVTLESPHMVPNLVEIMQLIEQIDYSTSTLAKLQLLLEGLRAEGLPIENISDITDILDVLSRPIEAQKAQFQWVDGLLVQALEEGHWLVLDNANLCSSSVLDRLNALLEPNGFLSINEHPTQDGDARAVEPHPDFRIFLTMDPRHGELSRAMRNRAIELFVDPAGAETHKPRSLNFGLESAMYRFRYFGSGNSNSFSNLALCAPQLLADHLSVKDGALFERFIRQVQMGLYSQSQQDVSEAICDSISALKLTDAPLIHEMLLPKERGYEWLGRLTGQSIHPLNNELLVRYTPHIGTRANGLARIFTLMIEVVNMSGALRKVAKDVAGRQPATPLEKSIVGQRSTRKTDSLANLAQFLDDVRNAIAIATREMLATEADMVLKDYYTLAYHCSQYWWQLFHLVQSSPFEEALVHALLTLWRKAITQHTQSPFVDIVTGLINRFVASHSLKTGLHMEDIWLTLRPKVCTTLSRLDHLLQLESLADAFDELIFRTRMPIEQLAGIRRSFQQALEIVVSADTEVEGLLSDLSKTVKQLDDVNSKSRGRPYFGTQFKELHYMFSLQQAAFPHDDRRVWELISTNALSLLPLLAAQPTKSVDVTSQSAVNHFEAIRQVDVLDSAGFTIGASQSILSSIRHRLENIKEVPLSHFDLLKSEIATLGGLLACNAKIICWADIHTLDQALTNLFDTILSIFSNEPPNSYLVQRHDDLEQVPAWLPQALQPVWAQLRSRNDETVSHRVTAVAWLTFAMGCIELYVPDRPYDPALKLASRRQMYVDVQENLRSQRKNLISFEAAFSGLQSNMRSRLLDEQLLEMGEHPPAPNVARPQASQLAELQVIYNNVLQIASKIRVDLASGNLEMDPTVLTNVSSVVRRLTNNFPAYRDLVTPLVDILRCLCIGLHLLQASSETRRLEADDCLATLRRLANGRIDVEEQGGEGVDLKKLQALAMSVQIEPTLPAVLKVRQGARQVFADLYHEWRERLAREQEVHAKKSNLYKYQGDRAAEEEVDEAEFEELFPDPLDERMQPREQNSEESIRNLTILLADLHNTIYRPTTDSNTPIEERLSKYLGSFQGGDDPKSDLSLVLLALRDQGLKLHEQEQTDKAYNMYIDPNIKEAANALALSVRVKKRFLEIQKVWPEHATLAEAIKLCNELAQFRHCEPVSKLLTKVEKLHETIHEWQTVASREFSATAQCEEVKNLIVHWRRLELSTWMSLLDAEDLKVEQNARSWWFVGYENIIAIPEALLHDSHDLREHAKNLFKTLESFVATTPQGQFFARLALLRQFEAELEVAILATPELKGVKTALENLVTYYDGFSSVIKERLVKGRRQMEKDLKEVVKLASWKDTTIDALRQSAKNSHRKLFKIIRKYRALLAVPVSSVTETGLPDHSLPPEPALDLPFSAITDNERLLQRVQTTNSDWTDIPTRFQRCPATIRLMHKSALADRSFDAASYIAEFLASFDASVLRLQKATPTILNDENKDAVKHLKVQKRMLFAETLKEMRRMGLQHNLSTEVLASQKSLAAVLSTVQPFTHKLLFGDAKSAEYYFLRSLDAMPRAREVLREHHGDLTPAEVGRSVGFLEALMQRMQVQHDSVAKACKDINDFSKTFREIEAFSLCEAEKFANSTARAPQLQAVRRGASWISSVLRLFRKVIFTQATLGQFNARAALEGIEAWIEELEACVEPLEKHESLPHSVMTVGRATDIDRAQNLMTERKKFVDEWVEQCPPLRPILELIIPWTEWDIPHTRELATQLELANFKDTLFGAVDEILGCVQDMATATASLPNTHEQPSWLNDEEAGLTQAVKALRISKVDSALKVLMNQTLAQCSDLEANTGALLVALVMPIIAQYQAICRYRIELLLQLHSSTAKMTHKLAKIFIQIGKEGFCTPSDKTSSGDDSNEKLEGGTGLGEGEGAEDISKDIGNDEDLTELAEEKDKNERQDEIEDEKDAVDMADADMEGQMGEVEEKQEDEEEATSGDEAEEEEMDEETGDVDDLGPSAVDEKMWDGADEEAAEKDKEGDRSKGERQEDAVAANENGEEQENDEADAEAEAGADESEDVPGEQPEQMDPYAQEGDKLDMPEDMHLDGESQDGSDDNSLGDLDDDMDLGDQEEQAGEVAEDAEEADATGEHDVLSEQEEEDNISEDGQERDPEAISNEDEADGAKDPEEDKTIAGEQTEANAADDAVQSESQGQGLDAEQESTDHAASAAAVQKGQTEVSDDTMASSGEAGEPGSKDDGQQEATGRSENIDSAESQAFKKLGDVLERWYKQHNPIQVPQEQNDKEESTKPNDVDMADADFQHLLDEETQADAQALGAASMDQAKALNDEMAVESNEQLDDTTHQMEDEDHGEVDDVDTAMEEAQPTKAVESQIQDPDQPKAFIGEKRQQDHAITDGEPQSPESDDSDLTETNDTLAAVHLTQDDPLEPSTQTARTLWTTHTARTTPLSTTLTEHLRLILAPTLATKLRGDHRTGKRLNVKRIIPYIASGYKRDKIWLRREQPSKRGYQVLVAVDDSKSMAEGGARELALDAVATVTRALATLEVGDVAVAVFGGDVAIPVSFGDGWSEESGVRAFSAFTFAQRKTDVARLVQRGIEVFSEARLRVGPAGRDLWQLMLVVSDGVCEDHAGIERLVRRAEEQRIMVVFIIVDAHVSAGRAGAAASTADAVPPPTQAQSIMDLQTATFMPDPITGEMQLIRRRYMDTFPFRWWVVVRDVVELPGVLAQALRQWFAEVVDVAG